MAMFAVRKCAGCKKPFKPTDQRCPHCGRPV